MKTCNKDGVEFVSSFFIKVFDSRILWESLLKMIELI